ncbi:carbohydrate ABC transporter permease [Allorhizocola rhizosphaerae]|uniref:carbohydrate ABC transporter permease n=1 Tax=Allorhizocola rhizosphaerae TaxID=1872709 RepID=UPI001FE62736|nr:carbohydrate ABC transporter permease [Allorhizocola rhizosphaerae]
MRKGNTLTYIALIVACLLSITPFYFMFIVATRKLEVINAVPPPLLPGGDFGENFGRVLANEHAGFMYGLINSLIVSTIVTICVVFFSSLAGFAFAKLRFRGQGAMLLIIITTMMIPTQLGVIPLYDMMVNFFQLDGDLLAVILPFLVSAFGVFMMRQYAATAVSNELIEAARVDGCTTFRIYWSVVLPALRPAMGVLGLLTFMEQWNSFLWPYAILNADTPTVQVSLALLASAYYTDFAQVFAATAVATIPLLLVFVVFGRQIIGGIMEGAVKA